MSVVYFLIFDGVAAVILWLLIARDSKAADRKKKRHKARQDQK